MAAVRSEPDPEPARPATPQPGAPVTPEALLRQPTLPPTAVNVAAACLYFCWNVSGLRRRNNSHRLVPGMDGCNEVRCCTSSSSSTSSSGRSKWLAVCCCHYCSCRRLLGLALLAE